MNSLRLRLLPGVLIPLIATLAPLRADPFQEVQIPLPWPDSLDVAVADMNGDGLPDVVALNSHGPTFTECNPPPGPIDCGDRMLLTVALNEGLGSFAPVTTTLAMCAPMTLATGDFNGDGRVDVMVGNRGAQDAFGVCSPPSVSFYPGDGAGGFGAPHHLQLASEPVDIAAGDLNGDGVSEGVLAVVEVGGLHVLRVAGDGTLVDGPQWHGSSSLPSSVAVGDLDLNGTAEIVVGFISPSEPIYVLRMAGTAPPVLLQVAVCDPGLGNGPVGQLAIGNFEGDARPEIAFGKGGPNNGSVTLFRRGPNSAICDFTKTVTTPIASGYGSRLVAANLDDNFGLDLATTDRETHVMTLLGDGAGNFIQVPPMTPATSVIAESIVAGDLDGQGTDDLAVSGNWFPTPTGMVLALLNQNPGPGVMWMNLAAPNIASWNAVTAAMSYDVVRGDLARLRASHGNFTQALEGCLVENGLATALSIPAVPPVGTGWWFIGRPNYSGGPGTYDDAWGSGQAAPRDPSINAAAGACP